MIKPAGRFVGSVLPAMLVLLAAGLAYYKIVSLRYDLHSTAPVESYFVETVLDFDGHGSAVEVSMSLPENLPDQNVSDESFNSMDLRFGVTRKSGDRRGVWRTSSVEGHRRVGYTATIIRDARKYLIDPDIETGQNVPSNVVRYLLPDSAIQSESPQVAALADSLGLSSDSSILFNASTMFDFVTNGLKYVRFSGTTDALTAYHLGEASCGGKSRLMVALARYLGIPARLVGGKILSAGRSTATHIWLELFVRGYWVPFCPTNNYFAEVPSHYLILYYGESSFLTHTRDINFKFFFNVKKRLVLPSTAATAGTNRLSILNIWSTFERAAISVELLRLIIMLPIGVLAVVFFRNLLGVETFGTFMPVLIAVGFRETGLLNGLLLFALVILFGAGVRFMFGHLRLLHTPRLAIILTSVIVFLLGLTTFGLLLGMSRIARVALFPLVIMTMTVERFCIISEEYGLLRAAWVTVLTMIVASVAFTLMSWRMLQIVVISFPEALLVVVALYIYIGRYSGFRATEFLRFREILRPVKV